MFDRNLLQDGYRFAKWITAYEEWDKIITLSKSCTGYQLSTVSKTLNDAQIPDHKLNPATVSLWTDAEMLEWKRIAVKLLLYHLKMILITLSFNHREEKPTALFFYEADSHFTMSSGQWIRVIPPPQPSEAIPSLPELGSGQRKPCNAALWHHWSTGFMVKPREWRLGKPYPKADQRIHVLFLFHRKVWSWSVWNRDVNLHKFP